MHLLRLLALFVIIWFAYRLLKRWLADKKPRHATKQAQEFVVKCAYCGVHVPESQALRHGKHSYCSPAHRDIHAAKQ